MAWLEEISHLLHWRTTARAQMVEDLHCEVEDLRSMLRTHTNCQAWWPHAIIPVLGGGRQLDPTSSLAYLRCPRPQWQILPQKQDGWLLRLTSQEHLTSMCKCAYMYTQTSKYLCVHMHVCVCTHMCTHTQTHTHMILRYQGGQVQQFPELQIILAYLTYTCTVTNHKYSLNWWHIHQFVSDWVHNVFMYARTLRQIIG